MKYIDEVDIKGKTVFIRVDFNVPLDQNFNITDDTRIRAVLPTIHFCLEADAKVILASHMGRPKGKRVEEFSLAPVARRLAYRLHKKVVLAPDCIGAETEKLKAEMKSGEVLLLENLRFHAEEEQNDAKFAKELMVGVDVYVDDAFAVAHRAHASVEAVTRYAPSCVAGFLMRDEVHYFHRAMEDPARPLAAVIGGAKISSKLTALKNMLKNVDKLIVGGAMANTFL
ncbi:MAG: phosphoglycerate kinase, partial [Desulfobaccales bacterium]